MAETPGFISKKVVAKLFKKVDYVKVTIGLYRCMGCERGAGEGCQAGLQELVRA